MSLATLYVLGKLAWPMATCTLFGIWWRPQPFAAWSNFAGKSANR
jgi:hypothetical protein